MLYSVGMSVSYVEILLFFTIMSASQPVSLSGSQDNEIE